MTRYLALPLLLASIATWAATDDPTVGRWQGKWGDGIRDALTLTPIDAGQMKVHYWRKLDADYRQAELQFDAIATVARTEPLTLEWQIEGDPQQGTASAAPCRRSVLRAVSWANAACCSTVRRASKPMSSCPGPWCSTAMAWIVISGSRMASCPPCWIT